MILSVHTVSSLCHVAMDVRMTDQRSRSHQNIKKGDIESNVAVTQNMFVCTRNMDRWFDRALWRSERRCLCVTQSYADCLVSLIREGFHWEKLA
jgi:hypothetical protein